MVPTLPSVPRTYVGAPLKYRSKPSSFNIKDSTYVFSDRVERLPRTVLVLLTAVGFDPLKDVTVTYSVSRVTLHVSENQKIWFRPPASTAMAQDEQLLLVEIEDELWLGAVVMVLWIGFVVEEFTGYGTGEVRC